MEMSCLSFRLSVSTMTLERKILISRCRLHLPVSNFWVGRMQARRRALYVTRSQRHDDEVSGKTCLAVYICM